MKKPSKFQLFKLAILIVMVVLTTTFIYFRGIDFKDCIATQYDLKRNMDFRILTGACTTKGKDGSLIYARQLRGFGSDDVDGHE